MLEVLRGALESHGGDPRRLTVEITETAAIADLDRAQAFAAALRAMGVRLALDDFGAGFASFQHLTRLHFDEIKIDGEYVRNLADDQTHQVLVRSLADLARGPGQGDHRRVRAGRPHDRAAARIRRALGPGVPPGPARAAGRRWACAAPVARRGLVGRRARAVARQRLVARLLAAVPEPVVQRPWRHAQARRPAARTRARRRRGSRARPGRAPAARRSRSGRQRRRRSASTPSTRSTCGTRLSAKIVSASRSSKSGHPGQGQVGRQDLGALVEAGVGEHRQAAGQLRGQGLRRSAAPRRPRPARCGRPGSRRARTAPWRTAPSARGRGPGPGPWPRRRRPAGPAPAPATGRARSAPGRS